MTNQTITTQVREQWLNNAVDELRGHFSAVGHPLPLNIRVTCGLPSRALRSGAIGECWSDRASGDGTHEVFISPVLADPREVYACLVHELIHTLPNCMNHGKLFQSVGLALGLKPVGKPAKPWGATVAGDTFDGMHADIIDSLGVYPHAALTLLAERKKQGTRMLKATCEHCGYTIRVTAKWATKGMPVCYCSGEFLLASDTDTDV